MPARGEAEWQAQGLADGLAKETQWWRPDRLAARRAKLAARGRILGAVRRFFAEAGFVEVQTPALQVSPGLEPHLKAFRTELHDPRDGAARPRYLHTSPEFAMKKLVAGGMPRIWQLAHAYRDGERSATHHPEFSMLEWYRAGAGWQDLVADCEKLLQAAQAAALSPAPHPSPPRAGRGTRGLPPWSGWEGSRHEACLTWQDRTADPADRSTASQSPRPYTTHTGIDILATAPDPAHPDLALLAAAAERIGIAPHPGDDWESLYFRIFLERIEPHLGIAAPTILYDYPVALAALSRPKPGDPRLAERFELYVCGLELANAFQELTDPQEQRARFRADQARKQALYGETYPVDEDFLAALEHGLPECAGIALGFDRLVMLATGAEHIEEVLWAPVEPFFPTPTLLPSPSSFFFFFFSPRFSPLFQFPLPPPLPFFPPFFFFPPPSSSFPPPPSPSFPPPFFLNFFFFPLLSPINFPLPLFFNSFFFPFFFLFPPPPFFPPPPPPSPTTPFPQSPPPFLFFSPF